MRAEETDVAAGAAHEAWRLCDLFVASQPIVESEARAEISINNE